MRLPVRCAFRSCGLGSRQTKRSAPACWRARLSECCDVDAASQGPKICFAQLFGRSMVVEADQMQGVLACIDANGMSDCSGCLMGHGDVCEDPEGSETRRVAGRAADP